MKDTIFDFLERKINAGEWLNDNHNNYTFLEFWDKFHSKKSFESVKKSFHYHMKKFVDMGMCKKSYS